MLKMPAVEFWLSSAPGYIDLESFFIAELIIFLAGVLMIDTLWYAAQHQKQNTNNLSYNIFCCVNSTNINATLTTSSLLNWRCLTVSCVKSPHYLVEFPGVFSLDHTHSFSDLLLFAFIARRWASSSEHIRGDTCNKHKESPPWE